MATVYPWLPATLRSSRAATLERCRIEYAGYLDNVGIWKTGTGVLTLRDSIIDTINGDGLRVGTGDATVTSGGNLFANCNYGIHLGVGASFDDTTSDFDGNAVDVYADGGTIENAATLRLKPDYSVYLSGWLTIAPGGSLTLEAGTVVKVAQSAAIYVDGRLTALGTPGAPVHLTDWRDDTVGGDANGDGDDSAPAPGWWWGIDIRNAGNATLAWCRVAYAGVAWVGVAKSGSGALSLEKLTVEHTQGNGLLLDGSTGAHMLRRCTFTDNGTGVLTQGLATILDMRGCNVAGNADYGVNNTGPADVDARQCWWGSSTGPLHPTLNPAGTGNRVSDRVLFEPWLPNDALGLIISPILSGTLMQGDALRFRAHPDGAAPGNTFTWDFGDGRTADGLNPGLVTFPASGTKTVTFNIARNGVPDPLPDGRTITVVPPATAPDLSVQSFHAPAAVAVSAITTLTYTAVNAGDAILALPASWTDAVYLSADAFLDATDVRLARTSVSRALAPGESYDGTFSVRINGDTHGQAYFILALDDQWQVLDKVKLNGERAAATDVAVPSLVAGTPMNGQFAGVADTAHVYKFEVGAGRNLAMAFSGDVRIYLRFGAFPSLREHDATSSYRDGGILTVPGAYPGTWYVMVVPEDGTPNAAYALNLAIGALLVTDVLPWSTANPPGIDTTLQVCGAGFASGDTVELVSSSRASYAARETTVETPELITAVFEGASVPPGVYAVRVTGATGSATLPSGLEIVAGGVGPELRLDLIVPDALGYHQLGTLYVTYSNVGDVVMQAPMIMLNAVQTGRPGALLTLDSSILNQGFWTSAVPAGFGTSVHFIGSGRAPGILMPGETIRVPVYYAGWLEPWDYSYPPFEFKLAGLTTDDTTPVDWDTLGEVLRPADIGAEAWAPVLANLRSALGTTIGSFIAGLDRSAAYLGRIGDGTKDVARLLAFEMLKARAALRPASELTAVVDLNAATGEVPLVFLRSFPTAITERYVRGPLGRGWRHCWQMGVDESDDGTLVFTFGNGGGRVFQPDSRGGYMAMSRGDTGSVSKEPDNRIVLTEANGVMQVFDAAGRLTRAEDRNGNSVALAYSGGNLTSLTHSRGNSLALVYTGSGLIESVTDSYGRSVSFLYDAEERLVDVTDAAGRSIVYGYDESGAPARRYALTRIEHATGTVNAYSYDALGRVAAVTNGTATTAYTYQDGALTGTDNRGATVSTWMDSNNLVAKAQDAKGSIASFRRNAGLLCTEVQASDGTTTRYEYDAAGALRHVRDALGNDWHLEYGAYGMLKQQVDPGGKVTRFEHDAKGNLTRVLYADGTSESWAHDATGRVTEHTKASGETITFTYNTNGDVTSKTVPGETIATFGYDAQNRVIAATNATGTTSFEYTPRGAVARIAYPNGTSLAYSYDANGRNISVTDHNGTGVRFSYDAYGRVAALADETGNPISSYDYDEAGQLTARRFADGSRTTWTTNASGEVTAQATYAADGTLTAQYGIAYAASDDPTLVTSPAGSTAYSYDALGHLTRSLFTPNAGAPVETVYERDSRGALVRTTEGGVATEYVADAMGRYTQIGSATAAYDANGNVVSKVVDGESYTYTYDIEDRPVAVATPAGDYQVTYDALGTALGITSPTTTVNYLHNMLGTARLFGEYDESGTDIRMYRTGLTLDRVDHAGQSYHPEFHPVSGAIAFASPVGLGRGPIGSSKSTLPYAVPVADIPFFSADEFLPRVGFFGLVGEGQQLTLADTSVSMLRDTYRWAVDDGGIDRTVGRVMRFSPFKDSVKMVGFALNSSLQAIAEMANNRAGDMTGLWLNIAPDAPQLVQSTCSWLSNNAKEISTGCKIIGVMGAAINIFDGMSGTLAAGRTVSILDAINPFGNFDKNTQSIRKGLWSFVSTSASIGLKIATTAVSPHYTTALAVVSVTNFVIESWAGRWLLEGLSNSLDRWFPPSDGYIGLSAGSMDPNQKLGALGFGPEGWIAAGRIFPYRIDFENDPTASAPAQVVTITDPLDADLDWATFEITEVGFGDHLIAVPANLSTFETAFGFEQDGKALELQVRVTLNLSTGLLEALFATIDPGTGLPPTVDYGFLPAEDGTGRGQGHLSYVVRPKAGLPTGTPLSNVAAITFDFSTTIATNQVDPHNPGAGIDPTKECLLTIDAVPPASSVNALPAESAWSFTVTCTSTELGSGVAGYTVYIQDNGGPWQLWTTTATGTATYTGETNHTYGFYCVAADNAGNREDKAAAVEASTTVTLNRYITVTAAPPTGGTVSGGGGYDYDSMATVTASPATGYHFVNWTEDGAAVSADATYSFTAALSRDLVAHFLIDSYTVTFVAGAHGSLTGQTTQTVTHGMSATPVTAVPAAGYAFSQWNDGSTLNPRTLTNLTGPATLTALFTPITYTLSFTAGAHGHLSGQTTQTANQGANSTPVTAVPDEGYAFAQWSDGSTQNPRTVTNVTSNLAVTASFRVTGPVPPDGEFLAQVDGAAAATQGFWDLTGTCMTALGGHPLTLDLAHDTKGKLLGTAVYVVAGKDGKAMTTLTMPIKGKVKGANGQVGVSIALKGADAAKTVSLSAKYTLTLNPATRRLEGTVSAKMTINGVKSALNEAAGFDLPAPMDGTWTLLFDLVQSGSAVTGTALLTLSNGEDFLFLVKGKTAGTGVSLGLKGDPSDVPAKGIKIKATVETMEGQTARIAVFSGKGLGQALSWTR